MKNFKLSFKKQKFVGLLNICCFSLSIMVSILVGLWAMHELSFDQFHEKKDRIYRILTLSIFQDQFKRAATRQPYAREAKEKLPDIEDACRIFVRVHDINANSVWHPDQSVYVVDRNFFSFFTFPLKYGVPEQVLSTPDRVVISERAARKMFPQQDPIGQTVRFTNTDFVVSGVMKDMPKNSSLQADFVVPFYSWYITNESSWSGETSCNAFLLMREGIKAEDMLDPVQQIIRKQYDCEDYVDDCVDISLESLNAIHYNDFPNDPITVKGNKSLIMIFILVAFAILVISCINFANLFVSTSFVRAKTTGIKKCFGAGKSLLMREFYLETACYVLVSAVLGLLLALLVLPAFNNFTQSELRIDFTSPQLYAFLAVLFVVTVLLAGSFPALYMTRFNVVETISGKFKGQQVSFLQKTLMVIQLSASIILPVVVVFMQKQVDCLLSHDLGFDTEHVVYVQGRPGFDKNFDALRGEFLKEPAITDVARKRNFLTVRNQIWEIRNKPAENQPSFLMEICYVSPDFFDVLGMEFVDGENPFHDSFTDDKVVINEAAVKLLELDQPVEKLLSVGGPVSTIKGVIKNAHTRSLHQEDVFPQVYLKLNNDSWNVVFFKINGNPQRAISVIEQKWKEREADYPFEYHFLDDTYKQLYQSEMNAGKVFSFAMLITLIITVAGLFAMVYYATRRRMREIALRKVHGATAGNIFVLLNKDFLLWVAIAFVIACPIAYYALYRWLSGFAVQTPLSAWGFLLVGAMAMLVTLLTTGYQTWKAATENPIKALKTE